MAVRSPPREPSFEDLLSFPAKAVLFRGTLATQNEALRLETQHSPELRLLGLYHHVDMVEAFAPISVPRPTTGRDPLKVAQQMVSHGKRDRCTRDEDSHYPLPQRLLDKVHTVQSLKETTGQRMFGEPFPIGVWFPGQGSQYVGMLHGVRDHPKVMAYAAIAQRVLGYDLLNVCLLGPESRLDETSVCQPAMFFAGMAGVELLRERRVESVDRPAAAAGLSLGEYTALCFAGVFNFEQGLELVKVRGEAMAQAAAAMPSSMISVAGLDDVTLAKLCADQHKNGQTCKIANHLFPKGFACAGTNAAIASLKIEADKAGALQAKVLKTSGGFHTDLMKPAQKRLEGELQRLLPQMKPPRCDVYMNVTGRKIVAGTHPAQILPLLSEQLVRPVLWAPVVCSMISDGLKEFYEVGPTRQLRAMMKRIDPSLWQTTFGVEV